MEHPNDGKRLLIGHLARRGIIVRRTRVCTSIHRVDPENTAIRQSVTIRRRVYHVDGPNSLWHIDGNHDTFHKLEEERHLNPLNEIDLYCLLYVFIPRINSTLEGICGIVE